VFRDGDIKPEAFMSSLDFFVYFPDEEFEQGFSREAFEAAASGALVFLPPRFKEAHGATAIYTSPLEFRDILNSFVLDKQKYLRAVKETQTHLKQILSNHGYTNYIRNLTSACLFEKPY